MRKIKSAGVVALFALVILGTWAMSRATSRTAPAAAAAAATATMNPLEMMTKRKDLPVHDIVDAY
jgi:cytochrome oxidase assembly protein ShyY1